MASDPNLTTDFEAFNCAAIDADGEPGVGITLYPPCDRSDVWLSWDETTALHAWLSRLMEAANGR